SVDQTVLYYDHAGGDDPASRDPDAVDAGIDAVEVDVAQTHGLAHVRGVETVERDVDAVGSGIEDRSKRFVAIDGDRLGDGERPEAAGIETVDLAIDLGLRDRAGEGLAGCSAAAWIGVVANA